MIIPFFSLRFFNALLIFCHHKNIVDNPYLIAFGPCAVSFFLMLSGFVMCHGYEGKILSSDFNYKNFLFHRFARLYPLHILCLFLWIGLNIRSIISGGRGGVFRILCNLFLVQSWIPDSSIYFSGNAVSWCLSDLFFFYAVFPLIIRLFQNKTRRNLFILFYFIFYGLSLLFIPKNYVHAFVYINPIFRFADFLIGILLYKFFDAKKSVFASKHLTGFFIQIFSILVSCYMIYIYPLVPEYLHFQALFFIPSALVILAFSLFKNTMLSSLLEKKLFKYLGEISFTFYMLHILGIAFVNIVISRLGVNLNFLYKSILDLVFVLIGSVLVYAFFEKPVAKKLVMVFDREYDS